MDHTLRSPALGVLEGIADIREAHRFPVEAHRVLWMGMYVHLSRERVQRLLPGPQTVKVPSRIQCPAVGSSH